MRRAFLAVTGLAAGTTLLVVLKGAPETTQVAGLASPERPPVVPAPSGSAPAARPSTAPRATATPTADAATATPTPSRTARTPDGRGGTTATPAPRRTTATPRAASPRTVTGPVVGNEYGNVQVQIVLVGTRIVDVRALELPEETAESDRRSSSVNSRYSGPDGEVVQRQGADLDTVSGATATSDAYQQSVQAAIDAARS